MVLRHSVNSLNSRPSPLGSSCHNKQLCLWARRTRSDSRSSSSSRPSNRSWHLSRRASCSRRSLVQIHSDRARCFLRQRVCHSAGRIWPRRHSSHNSRARTLSPCRASHHRRTPCRTQVRSSLHRTPRRSSRHRLVNSSSHSSLRLQDSRRSPSRVR